VKAEFRLLPLLEFALDELYKQRSAEGLLTFEAYRVHLDGSIVRALAKRADATSEDLPEPSRDAFRSVMRRLATTWTIRPLVLRKGYHLMSSRRARVVRRSSVSVSLMIN
jgi:hypothetical protein